ncbi:MAG: PAS domain-containing protein, partial [Myxococcota bacterium]
MPLPVLDVDGMQQPIDIDTGLFEKLVLNSLDLFCVANLDGYLSWVSPQFEQTLGWTREELSAQPYISFVHPGDVESTLAELRALNEGCNA